VEEFMFTCLLKLTKSRQVESFIPLWEWDLPKKKKKKSEKGSKKDKSKATDSEKLEKNGGAFIEEVEETRPSTKASVEEVPDEDDH
jgi:translocation protein SEC62